MCKVALTGHRPEKLYGYNLDTARYGKLSKALEDLLIEVDAKEVYDGMALGFDTVGAITVLEMRESGRDIKLHCCIPCLGHSSVWVNKKSIEMYDNILEIADETTYVSDKPYTKYCMQKRNEFMVDNSDIVIACWDGTKGGTYNCIEYALKLGKKVLCIRPMSLDVSELDISVLSNSGIQTSHFI